MQPRSLFEPPEQYASNAVPVVAPDSPAGAVRRALIGRRFDCASHVVVCDGPDFRGVVRIEQLLAAPEDAAVRDLMDAAPAVVAHGADQEAAAWRAVQNRESALTVVDSEGRFRGLIPPHRLLALLLAEHEEDLARLGGFLRSAAAVRSTSEESVLRRFKHRLPWLLLGLAGALLSAEITGWYEGELTRQVTLFFFLPGIVYLADAVGTQTETVVVRALSVGVSLRRMLWRELLSGLVIGAMLALLTVPLLLLRWHRLELAAGVALALFAACSTATLVAMTLPWLLTRTGLDPAFGSGPLATVIQDLLSIAIYFYIATTLIV